MISINRDVVAMKSASVMKWRRRRQQPESVMKAAILNKYNINNAMTSSNVEKRSRKRRSMAGGSCNATSQWRNGSRMWLLSVMKMAKMAIAEMAYVSESYRIRRRSVVTRVLT
jgi:hypothetical protein